MGCRFLNRYVTKTVKYGGGSIMVWGAIKGDGSRILIKCPMPMNSVNYQRVLDQGLSNIYEDGNIFMQDGAPCHTSKSTISYLDQKKICVLSDWPPQSPDINIIENMWSVLKEKVSRTCPKSLEDLWIQIQKEWYDIDYYLVLKLYDSIPERLNVILKNKGLHNKY